MKRKSQGLSLNMVVVGAIAIVVLVVIVLIFNASMQNLGEDLEGDYDTCLTANNKKALKDTYGKTEILRLSDLETARRAGFSSLEKYCTAPTSGGGKGGTVYKGTLEDIKVGSGNICCVID